MSSSGLIAARKRLENAIKKYDIPTEPEPKQVDKCEDGVLLLSLLQSRLNWSNAIFARYKTDPIQQPKRTSNTRRKWPNMKYLGTCTLQLGAHIYEHTNFYEATRSESWKDIAIKQGLMKKEAIPEKKPEVTPENNSNVVMRDVENSTNSTEPENKPDVVMEEAESSTVVVPDQKQDAVMEEADKKQDSEIEKTLNAGSEQNTTAAVENPTTTEQAETNIEKEAIEKTQTSAEDTITTNVEVQANASTESSQKQSNNETAAANALDNAQTETHPQPQPQSQPPPQPQQPQSQPQPQQSQLQPQEVIPDEKLTFVDIVFELKEFPNERFIFPKDAIVQSTPTGPNPEDCLIIASFVLPLDLTQTEEFFQKPKDKILKYGDVCQLPCVKHFYRENATRETRTADPPLALDSYQPVNIRMTYAKSTTANALKEYVYKTEVVRKSMKDKMKLFPKRTFLKFDVSDDETRRDEIRELIKRASVAPDISTGPVQAEKKRNEILNQIRLGKRERDEKFESELPKNKLNARDDGFMKCAYCSTKQTSMWRAGPGGHGTLCNSCGIQWSKGHILKDAPVIGPEEEKRLLREKKEKERIAEALEMEKAEKEEEKLRKKAERQGGGTSHHHHDFSSTSGTFAAQLLQQRNRQKQVNIPPTATAPVPVNISAPSSNGNTPSTTIPSSSAVVVQQPKANVEAKKALPSKSKETQPLKTPDSSVPIASAPPPPKTAASATPSSAATQQPTQQQAPPVPLSLYSPAGIPLPTLSIDFAGHMQFTHPNCGITLLDRHFSVRLFKDGCDQTTIEFDKKDLTNAVFEVVTEGEAALKREVLKMKIVPIETKKITAFKKNMKIDKKNGVNIRFLEKLDPSGGAVVQRILQRWLVTAPQ